MLKRSLKWSAIYILEAIAVLLALAIFGVGAIFWRLSSGPVDLDFLRADAQAFIAQAFEGEIVALGTLQASFDPQDRSIVVTARDITVAQSNGEVITRAPQIEAGVSLSGLLLGQIEPTSLVIDGGSLSFVRRADGAVGAGLGGVERISAAARLPERGGDDSASLFALLQEPASSDAVLGEISRIEIRNAAVRIVDEISGIAWLVDQAGVGLDRDSERILLEIDGRLATVSGFADLELRLEAGAQLNALLLQAQVDNLTLASVAPDQGPLSGLRALDAPLRFDLVMDALRDTGIRTASLELDIGEGRLLLEGEERAFRGAGLSLRFDPMQGALEVTRGELDSDAASGRITGRLDNLSGYTGAIPTRGDFQVQLEEGFIDLGPIFERPPAWQALEAQGSLDLTTRSVGIDQLLAQVDDVVAELSGEASLSEVEDGRWLPNLRLSGPVLGDVTAETVLAYWPILSEESARNWVQESIMGGRFYNARFDVDLDAEAIARGALANEQLNLSFDFENAAVRYISTMTPITEGRGRATLYGNSFEVEMESGRVGELEILEGYVDIPRLVPKGAIARFGGRGRGSAAAMLALIDEEPLNLPTDYGIDPQSVGGSGEASFEIQRAMLTFVPPEEIGFTISGEFEDVTLDVPNTPLTLSEGIVRLEANQDGLRAQGQAMLIDTPVNIDWFENFLAGEGEASTRMELSAQVGARALDHFGIPARRFLSGEIALEANAISNGLDIQEIDVDADFTNAILEAPRGVWIKPEGVPGMAGFTLSRGQDNTYVLEEILAQTEGVDIAASAIISEQGRLVEAIIDRLLIDGFVSLNGRLAAPSQPGFPFAVRLTGDYLDARELLPYINDMQSGGAEAGLPLSVTFDVGRLVVSDQSVLQDFSLIWRSDAIGVRAMSMSGRSVEGPFFADFGAPEEGGIREFRAETQSIEALSALLGFEGYIQGGRLSVLGEAPPLGENGPLTARVEVGDITLVRVPVLARILAAGSFEGLGNLLNGEGIRFDTISTDVLLEDDVITLADAQATGSSLGVTASGSIDLGERYVAVDGNLAPSYVINSFLGELPVIGELLVSRPGEGLIGITYSVEGPFESMTVFANPLSVFAPGVFRRMFEGTAASRAERERANPDGAEPETPSILPQEVLEQLQPAEVEPQQEDDGTSPDSERR
ncbi:MAG: hypothetical protein GYB36_06810 [Alphaproteobacteria bacterium]|nr:hypothetical protein [Alphaproteobacteria bacterium]